MHSGFRGKIRLPGVSAKARRKGGMAEAQTIVEPQTGALLIPIPVRSLRVDTMTDFDLYLPSKKAQAPVLYRHKNLPFTEQTCQRLRDSQVEVLYVDSRQKDTYHRYLERHLGPLLADPNVDLQTKSTVLYTSARGLVKDVLEDPRSGDVIERSEEFVQHTTEYMFSEKSALEGLMKVTSFDYYTYTHSVNVFVFGVSLAQRTGIDLATMRRYGMGALLHDIGKNDIAPAIINCKGKLSDEQWQAMKMHPVYGCDILRAQGVRDEIVLDVTRHHHEKLNGNGYPDGLRGRAISRFARCTTVADVFDALTTQRSYKNALNSYPALKLIKEEMTDEVDRELFHAFVLMIGNPSG